MKLMLCLLTSYDLPRLKRLVYNVQHEIFDNKFFDFRPIIVVNTLSEDYYQSVLREHFPYPVVRTESNGKPGKGKNSCCELFLQSDCDFLTQFDGDDILYPTYLLSLQKHLEHYNNIDILGIIPMDVIQRIDYLAGHFFNLEKDINAGVWGLSEINMSNRILGINKNDVLWDHPTPPSADYIILQSKIAAKIKMDEDLPVGEDHLWSLEAFSKHIKGELRYFHTYSSDFFVIDRTNEKSIQNQYPQEAHVEPLREKARLYVKEERSSLGELPIIYKKLLLNQFEKEHWIKRFWNKTRYAIT